tara:strand:+ start:461 stop:964 length:504 start_codon:yes stop_codon:yes gene_type:complete
MIIKTDSKKNKFCCYFIIYNILIIIVSMPLRAEQSQTLEMNQWLKARFSDQHQALIPIVAVADMLYGCQQDKQIGQNLTIQALMTPLDKNTLAKKLMTCLAGESPKSDVALNYGLRGCFSEQFANLTAEEKLTKMRLVTQAIAELSRSERQKSFTQCVTDQSIHYLR